MPVGALLDTGPLVAYLYPRDNFHSWAVEQFDAAKSPFLTCEAALAEACFLTTRNGQAPVRVLQLLDSGVVEIGLDIEDELDAIRALMERYANVPMSLADACLVRLAEMTGLPLCTLDSDFTIYRAQRRRPLNLILPIGAHGLHEP
jgi:uncharacterized protein